GHGVVEGEGGKHRACRYKGRRVGGGTAPPRREGRIGVDGVTLFGAGIGERARQRGARRQHSGCRDDPGQRAARHLGPPWEISKRGKKFTAIHCTTLNLCTRLPRFSAT